MADTSLRRELDAIAMELEQKGHSKLASVVDICNHEIHSRKASVKPSKPAKSASAPKRQPKPAKSRVSAARVAGAAKALKDIRWARTELRDIAKEYRKLGSLAQARQLLRMAEDLAEDETELMEIAGPVVDVDTAVEGEDLDIDLDTPVDDDSADDECVCPEPEYDDEAPETYDDTVEEDEEEEVDLSTVEACAKEIRAIARELRREGDHRNASIMSKLACECENMTVSEDPSVVVIPLPETDGGAPPIDATNFALGDDENLLDFAVEVVEDGEPVDLTNEFSETTEESEEIATEEEVNPEESREAEEFLTTAATLKRTARRLRAEGLTDQANALLRKSSTYKSIAKRRAAAAKPAKKPAR